MTIDILGGGGQIRPLIRPWSGSDTIDPADFGTDPFASTRGSDYARLPPDGRGFGSRPTSLPYGRGSDWPVAHVPGSDWPLAVRVRAPLAFSTLPTHPPSTPPGPPRTGLKGRSATQSRRGCHRAAPDSRKFSCRRRTANLPCHRATLRLPALILAGG